MKIYLFCNDETRSAKDFIEVFKPEKFSFNSLNEKSVRNQEELSAEILQDKISGLKNSDLIVIQLEEELENLCFYIGHRIRLHPDLRTKPLVFFGKKSVLNLISESPFLPMILLSKGTRYYENNLLITSLKEDIRFITSEAIELSNQDIFQSSILRKLRLPEPDKQGRHSIANQWGARQLAMVSGVDISEHQISSAIYFQLLTAGLRENDIRKKIEEEKEKRKSSSSVEKSAFENNIPKVKRVLMIDDNHDKGWSLVLSKLFAKGNNETCVDAYKSFSSECIKSLKANEYDFVLLDFYFGEGDTKGRGLKILKDIKQINPVLPVIMFTASNKAWNMDTLYEAGADGFYVKEHPDTANDSDFSIKNFENFEKSIGNCINKGDLLKPFWKAIKNIKNDSIIKEKSLLNQKTSKFKERIHERLLMFIGLLKKAFEQTSFDKNAFFYSEYELAFLTLWSVLNEIQEVSYSKITGIPERKDGLKLVHNHSDASRTPILNKWILRSSNLLFLQIEGDYNSRGELQKRGKFYVVKTKSNFTFDAGRFSPASEPQICNEWATQLYIQILFILQKSDFSSNPNAEEIIKKLTSSLLVMNPIRNKIYLTHGGNPNSPEFGMLYSTHRKEPDRWHQHINDLFSIVYFLCTATEWKPDERPAEPQS